MSEEKETNQEMSVKPAEEVPMVERQTETAKAVRKTVSAKTKKRTAAQKRTADAPVDRIIKDASNPPRPDVKYIEKGDLLIPVEDK